MDDSEFHRLKRLPPYVFAEVNAMKARARAAGQDIIDLGMGNPDLPTAPHIVAKLAEAAANPRAHGYSASRGIPGLRKAQAAYYAAPLRRRARSRERDHRHAGLEGRPRQSRAGDHLAGRHRAGAQPELSDPSLRLHHRRRLGAPHPGAGRDLARGIPAGARARGAPYRAQADRAGAELSVEPDGAGRRSRFLCGDRRFLQTPAASGSCPTSPMPRSISTAMPPPSVLQVPGRARHRRRVHLDEQDLLDGRAGASASPPATRR